MQVRVVKKLRFIWVQLPEIGMRITVGMDHRHNGSIIGFDRNAAARAAEDYIEAMTVKQLKPILTWALRSGANNASIRWALLKLNLSDVSPRRQSMLSRTELAALEQARGLYQP